MSFSAEAKTAFEQHNPTTIEDALEQTNRFIQDGNKKGADLALQELSKFIHDSEEFVHLEQMYKDVFSADDDSQSQEEPVITSSSLEEVTKQERVVASIGYIGWGCIIPLVLYRKSEFCQHHAKQSLLINILLFFLFPFGQIFAFLISNASMLLVSLFVITISCYGIFQASRGKMWTIPFIGDVARNFTF